MGKGYADADCSVIKTSSLAIVAQTPDMRLVDAWNISISDISGLKGELLRRTLRHTRTIA